MTGRLCIDKDNIPLLECVAAKTMCSPQLSTAGAHMKQSPWAQKPVVTASLSAKLGPDSLPLAGVSGSGHKPDITSLGSGSLGSALSATSPLLYALQDASRRSRASFHFPGHRRGYGAPNDFRELIGWPALEYDLPELPELDNLFAPEGAIAEAQKAAAKVFGAEETRFLVNGTTVGIHAAVMSTCGPGDVLVLPRNCHMSAFSAMVLSGAVPKYVAPVYDSLWEIAHGVTAEAVKKSLEEVREAGGRVGAVLVVSPTYYGISSDLQLIAATCRSFGVPLIVDEAHGAHFRFHSSLPPTALECGADVAVQSTHKVLSSLTQSAMLHRQGQRVSRERLGRALQILQSSSPSYLLLSSLDAAQAQMAGAEGHGDFNSPFFARALALADAARKAIADIPGVSVLDMENLLNRQGIAGFDPLRLTVSALELGMNGFALDDYLREEHGVVAELPTLRNLMFAFSLGSTQLDADLLVHGLQSLSRSKVAAMMGNSKWPLEEAHGDGEMFAKDCKDEGGSGVGKPSIPLELDGLVQSEGQSSFSKRAFGDLGELDASSSSGGPCNLGTPGVTFTGTGGSEEGRGTHSVVPCSFGSVEKAESDAQVGGLGLGRVLLGKGIGVDSKPGDMSRANGEIELAKYGPSTSFDRSNKTAEVRECASNETTSNITRQSQLQSSYASSSEEPHCRGMDPVKVAPWELGNDGGETEATHRQMSPRDTFFATSERVPLCEAVGRICAELVCPYPPGIPLLFPGEVVTEGSIDRVAEVLRLGGTVVLGDDGGDCSDRTLSVIVKST